MKIQNFKELLHFCFVIGCKIAVYLATGTAVILEPESGNSCTAKELLQAIVDSEELALPPYAGEVFSLWMASSFLGYLPFQLVYKH